MLPFKTLIHIDRSHSLPIFVQISNSIAHLIKTGVTPQNMKLPGTRAMSQLLEVHRMTVVAAYDELLSQGWLEAIPSKGTFVSSKLPLIKPQQIAKTGRAKANSQQEAGFQIYKRPHLNRNDVVHDDVLTINDGTPDIRIAPAEEISRLYKSTISREYNRHCLDYGSIYGDDQLRECLVDYLNETRGLNITIDNILITRGSQMGMYLATQLLLKSGDNAMVGNSNYISSDLTLIDAGANLLKVPVDKDGIDTTAVERICQAHKIRALYVTPHHHHPTTVTLSAERRVHLLSLANQYGFMILEDDYDYDFHYQSSPLLPLASADRHGMVAYLGALTKLIAPAYRIGYMIASSDLIQEAGNLRRIIDRQGDAVLERVMAQMIRQGYLQRHSKKALRIYKDRRDYFVRKMKGVLSDYIRFQVPEGGMAIWAAVDKQYPLSAVTEQALARGLRLPLWTNYDQGSTGHNYIRLGFASLNKEEIDHATDILLGVFRTLS